MSLCSYCGKYKYRQTIPHDCPEKAAALERAIVASLPNPPPIPRPKPPNGSRHCLYYVLPANHNGVWQRNIEQLKARQALFTGRKVCVIAHGNRPHFAALDPPEKVQKALGDGWDYHVVRHDKSLREMAAWDIWWNALKDHGPDDVAWIGQAKGVSKPVNPGVTVHRWTDVMRASLLDYWPLVEELLRCYPIVGSFKKLGENAFGGSRSLWHYSGSHAWFRVKDAWEREPMRRVDRKWFGIESWPGLAFAPEEGGVVFMEGKQPHLNLYLKPIFDVVLTEWEVWKEHHSRWHAPVQSLQEVVT